MNDKIDAWIFLKPFFSILTRILSDLLLYWSTNFRRKKLLREKTFPIATGQKQVSQGLSEFLAKFFMRLLIIFSIFNQILESDLKSKISEV